MAVSKKASLMLIVVGTALWGIIGIFTRALLSDGISPIQIAMVRCLITATVLGLFILLFKRDRFRIDVKDIWMFFGTGILSIAFFNICYFTAMDYLTISLASVLLYTSPYFVLIMSMILFKEKLTKRKVLALLMAFSGCMFSTGVFTGFEGISMVGLMFGILSGFGYALYSIFGRYALEKGYSSVTISFYTFLFAAVIFWPLSKSGTLTGIKIFSGVHENVEGKYADEKRRSSERSRLAAMSESFDALATTFLKLSDKNRYPGTYELREMCNTVINKHGAFLRFDNKQSKRTEPFA